MTDGASPELTGSGLVTLLRVYSGSVHQREGSPLPKFRWIVLAVFALSSVLGVGAQDDANELPDSLKALPRTDAGEWDGTWFYISRLEKMVLWIRTDNGKPEAKIRYQSKISPEYFETDWNGQVDPVISCEAGLENAMLFLAMKDRKTWSTRKPLFAIDRIYYRHLHLVDVQVLSEDPWNRLSDHFPVQGVFEDTLPGGEA